MAGTFQKGAAPEGLAERNHIFGFPIPLGHLAVLDFNANTAVLYQHWRKVGNPAAYLAGYWGVEQSQEPA